MKFDAKWVIGVVVGAVVLFSVVFFAEVNAAQSRQESPASRVDAVETVPTYAAVQNAPANAAGVSSVDEPSDSEVAAQSTTVAPTQAAAQTTSAAPTTKPATKAASVDEDDPYAALGE